MYTGFIGGSYPCLWTDPAAALLFAPSLSEGVSQPAQRPLFRDTSNGGSAVGAGIRKGQTHGNGSGNGNIPPLHSDVSNVLTLLASR
jgi:hypothetical protein